MSKDVKEKRTWVFLQSPKIFAIAGCSCGNEDTQWSEFRTMLWCEKCQVDFVPEHNGVFDGPILRGVAEALGISFTRFNLETQKVEMLGEDQKYVECQDIKKILETNEINIRLINLKKLGVLKCLTESIIVEDLDRSMDFRLDKAEFFIMAERPMKIILDVFVEDGIIKLFNNKDYLEFKNFLLSEKVKKCSADKALSGLAKHKI